MNGSRSNSPQFALLGLLLSQPMHGYELHQEFERELGQVWQIGLSQLYAQLKHLEEAGLVSSQTKAQGNRPPRKVYHLTSEGHEVFDHWVHQPTPYLRHIRIEFLARLYFFHRHSLSGIDDLVIAQKNVCQEQLDRFAEMAHDCQDKFRQLVLEFRRGQLDAVVSWLDRSVEIITT